MAIAMSVATMTSLELVDFINNQRGEGEATLAHSDFLKKVLLVLGGDAGKFSAIYLDSMNREKPCYRFPKREACLLAMSYSYDLQAKVFDRMTALEAGQAPALPQTFADALRLAADEHERRQAAEAERDEAVRTKSLIGSRREATAMATASAAKREAAKLEIELDKSKEYATVKRMEMLYHGTSFNWRLLKSTAAEMGVPAIDVFDANYGTVKAYHACVWAEAYAVAIGAEDVA